MATEPELTQVVFICEQRDVVAHITTALETQKEFSLADVLSDPERLVQDLHNAAPEIILVDHHLSGQPTLDIIDDLAMEFPEAAVVAILPNDNPSIAQQVTLAGARAFIVQPFTQANLLSTLRRVRDLQIRQRRSKPAVAAPEPDKSRPPHTFAVFSPRGGVGCSTLAANLAIALHEDTGSKVLLMEGKLFFGHLAVMLNIRPRNNLADLIPHAASIDEGLLREVVTEHISGIQTLLAPTDLQVAQGIRPQDMFSIMTKVQRYFDYIVIDAGSSLNENTVTLMDLADRVLLVATPELAALHDVSRFIRISQTLAYPNEKILLVLNESNRPGGVKPKELKTFLHWGIFAQIPDDTINAMRSLNRGIPLVINSPRSPASRSYHALAKHLTNFSNK